MKKAIALVLAVILLAGIISTALACSHNNWHTANTAIVGTGYQIYNCRQGSCPNRYASHKHWKTTTKIRTTYVCFTCGDIKQITTTSVGKKDHCSLVDPVHK